MPVYEYECPGCGTVLERDQPSTERHKAPKCAHCGRKTRLIPSHTAFVLKGSGWYATDYATKEKKS